MSAIPCGALASLLTFAAVFAAAAILARTHPPPRLPGGERGERRKDALARWPALGALFAIVHLLAAQLGPRWSGGFATAVETRLARAGYPLGLDAREIVVLCALASAGLAASGAVLTQLAFGAAVPGAVVGALFGAAAPFIELDGAGRRRERAIVRGLPRAIDLIALAMQGGGDLLSGLGHVVAKLAPRDPLRFELVHILRRLSLGESRGEAFRGLGARVPLPVVKQFVAAVLQGEKQGTPLSEVLATQARVMRQRRSEAAEEAAARAAILILGPLMLIFACVFVVLLGPFIIKGIRGELF